MFSYLAAPSAPNHRPMCSSLSFSPSGLDSRAPSQQSLPWSFYLKLNTAFPSHSHTCTVTCAHSHTRELPTLPFLLCFPSQHSLAICRHARLMHAYVNFFSQYQLPSIGHSQCSGLFTEHFTYRLLLMTISGGRCQHWAPYPLLGGLQFCGVAAWAQPGCIFYSESHEAKLSVSWCLTRGLWLVVEFVSL